MRLTKQQLELAIEAGCVVELATRFETTFWNRHREPDEPRVYGGYYWWLRRMGRAETDLYGPYRTPMAAYSAAYDRLILRRDSKRLTKPGRIPAHDRGRHAA